MRSKSVGRQKMVDTRVLKVKSEQVKVPAVRPKGPHAPGEAPRQGMGSELAKLSPKAPAPKKDYDGDSDY